MLIFFYFVVDAVTKLAAMLIVCSFPPDTL